MDHYYDRRELLQLAARTFLLGTALDVAEESVAVGALPRRVLGKTGASVSILGFGTASSGIRRNTENAVQLYNAALEAGINYFDTAPLHTGYGNAQKQLAPFLKERRKEVFLVTKTHESDGDAALRLLERNLKEMKVDQADLVHAHSLGALDMETALGKNGVFAALQKAKAQGLTRFIGVSGHHRPSRFLRVIAECPIDVMMCAVNFADRYTYDFEGKVFPKAAEKKIGLVAMKVFGGPNWESNTMSNSMMPALHLPVALRYALALPSVALAVVGMATEEELRKNVAWATNAQPLSAEERATIASAGQKLADAWGAHFGATG